MKGTKNPRPQKKSRREANLNLQSSPISQQCEDIGDINSTYSQECTTPIDSNLHEEDKIDLILSSTFQVCEDTESLELPCGFRFLPDDDELIVHFLLNKILNRRCPNNAISTFSDLYKYDANALPIKEFQTGKEIELYYFMEVKDEDWQKKVIPTCRGEWVQTGDEEAVCHGNALVGFRKNMIFQWRSPAPKGFRREKWIVNEFRLNVGIIPKVLLNQGVREEVGRWVACRVIKST